MYRIEWRYLNERGDYADDNSKNRGFSLVEVDEEHDMKTTLKEFYASMTEPVQIIDIIYKSDKVEPTTPVADARDKHLIMQKGIVR
jgi:hypothetical protein|tara:strand:- start:1099 stop:1356 length:258 start_codon:yes stop_codon:yes gene_type:complete